MPVDSEHPEYEKWKDIWKRCRDVVAGQDAVHDAGETYLPTLANETTDAYAARKGRAVFYGATSRTVDGFSGLLFRKSPTIDSEQEILDDVNLAGLSYVEFMKKAAIEALEVNRFGLLVDYPTADTTITTADAQARGLRPYIGLYKAESIINWKTGKVDGKNVFTQVVLVESVEIEGDDEFEPETEERYRVLDLVEGYYRVRVFKSDDKEDEQIGDDLFPLMNNKKMTFIPFYIYPAVDVEKPALLDLVNMNVSHYHSTADYEHGCHISGLPTLFLYGYKKQEGETIYIGGPTAQALPDAQAKAEYVGVDNVFQALNDNISKKENLMAVLGSRMLEQQKKAAETEEVASIHRAGEAATLSSMSILLSRIFTRALQTMFDWAAINEEVVVTVNGDFTPYNIKPELITALLASVQAGKMSDEAFFNNLKAGEMYGEEDTFDDEQARIDNQPFGEPI